ncbi:hypothetical protein [Pseudoleptotrichia goodfellowii]|jgi:hypothetical protein|uniref:Uncharacterized protein n=1 Tax=Pseudoleptotrichia goodfellowii F0264 TaxID=596323 RepID=D0GNX2_9FUSO|nr:hypothetical protein [Pseudoleptotrichia goodfellowii]EEY34208.1 hypothetical protein HMPREF0554_0825 [Pseudoleptotrichia goodfellowii F0264]DAN70602.1 MAG TPA: hypothetical protein [Caudoviricetes sp.]
MPKLKLTNVYAKDETGKGYKVYEELEIEFQDNGDDEKLAKIINSNLEGTADRLETYDALAEDMIISPEGARSHKFFGKNAAAVVNSLLPFLLKYGNEDMISANKKLKVVEVAGE